MFNRNAVFLDEETADNFCTTVVTDKIYLQEKQRYIYT